VRKNVGFTMGSAAGRKRFWGREYPGILRKDGIEKRKFSTDEDFAGKGHGEWLKKRGGQTKQYRAKG